MTRPQPEFLAKIVPLDAVVDFSQANPGPDPAAAWIATQQLNLVTTPQLKAAGLSYDAICTRCKRGSLHRVHQSVFSVGSPVLIPGARELAAVLACGGAAVVSHRAAAALWGFAEATDDAVDITVVGDARRRREGIRVHRTAQLNAADRRLRNGIPVTAPALALLDFASQAGREELEQAIAEAYALRLTSEAELQRVLDRHPHRPGGGALRAELKREGAPALTRSEAERRMKRLVRAARLPAPKVNARVAGYVVDFYWPEQRLIVEVDGYQYHGHRVAFERDRRKGLALETAGYQLLRLTRRQLVDEALVVAAALAVALRGSRVQH